jgi:hypothetical protein
VVATVAEHNSSKSEVSRLGIQSEGQSPFVPAKRYKSLRSQVLESKPVLRALELGWKMRPIDEKSYRHFHFYRHGFPIFSAHFYAHTDQPSFTIGNVTTTYVPKAIEYLEKAEKL